MSISRSLHVQSWDQVRTPEQHLYLEFHYSGAVPYQEPERDFLPFRMTIVLTILGTLLCGAAAWVRQPRHLI